MELNFPGNRKLHCLLYSLPLSTKALCLQSELENVLPEGSSDLSITLVPFKPWSLIPFLMILCKPLFPHSTFNLLYLQEYDSLLCNFLCCCFLSGIQSLLPIPDLWQVGWVWWLREIWVETQLLPSVYPTRQIHPGRNLHVFWALQRRNQRPGQMHQWNRRFVLFTAHSIS